MAAAQEQEPPQTAGARAPAPPAPRPVDGHPVGQPRRAYEAAIEATKHLLSVDLANEVAHRRLMRILAVTGQRQQALRQYDVLRESLQRELDAEPDRESKRLREQILSGQFASGEADH